MFKISKEFISEDQIIKEVSVDNMGTPNIDEYWDKIAIHLDLKLINPYLSLYENKDGTFILSKYGFIKQRVD